jgi:hypothetical protein
MLQFYEETLQKYRDLLLTLKDPDFIKGCQSEIERIEKQIENLKNEHVNCVTPCCLGCTADEDELTTSSDLALIMGIHRLDQKNG